MGCIETLIMRLEQRVLPLINRNMGCIETGYKDSHPYQGGRLIETWDVLKLVFPAVSNAKS